MPDLKPSVGRIVHYYGPHVDPSADGVGPIAAIISAVNKAETGVELHFYASIEHHAILDRKAVAEGPRYVEYSETEPPQPHTWRWPSLVQERREQLARIKALLADPDATLEQWRALGMSL